MKKYEILDHRADLKIKAFGRSLSEVFVNMALGVASQQTKKLEGKKVNGVWQKITIESTDLESLLVDWLNEILYQGEINQRVYFDFEVLEFSEMLYKMVVKIRGRPLDERLIEIKAATFYELEIKKNNKHWEATVIFDI